MTNEKRRDLIKLIHENGLTIVRAAEMTGIYYPTAKAINKVFKNEKRIVKRGFRCRTKKNNYSLGINKNIESG